MSVSATAVVLEAHRIAGVKPPSTPLEAPDGKTETLINEMLRIRGAVRRQQDGALMQDLQSTASRHENESQLDYEIRLWWAEHARIGPFGYWPLMVRAVRCGTEMPELWFPDAEPPWDEETKREWLRRANEFIAMLKAAREEIQTP